MYWASRTVLIVLFLLQPVTLVGGQAIKNNCGRCHSAPSIKELPYTDWKDRIQVVPKGSMPVINQTEKNLILESIKTKVLSASYQSRCSACHDLPNLDSLRHKDWMHRLYVMKGLRMPVMNLESKEQVLREINPSYNSEPRPYIDRFEFPRVSKNAPLFEKRLKPFKNQVTLLHFWSKHCGPCLAELPELDTYIQRANKKKNVKIALISTDKNPTAIPTVKKMKSIKRKQLIIDTNGTIRETFMVNVYPTTYLIGKNGKIIARMLGRLPWGNPKFIKTLESLYE
jgi:thiol-disulfide isomerase/thioredoxin